MGLDFTILKGDGILLDLSVTPSFVREYLATRSEWFQQDNYGAVGFKPYGLLCFEKPEILLKTRLSTTVPAGFSGNGVYPNLSHEIRGGNSFKSVPD